jgi:transcriptional regulator with XRE-family HTH domain
MEHARTPGHPGKGNTRTSRNIPQEQLAVGWGISREYLQRMEAGKRPVSGHFLSPDCPRRRANFESFDRTHCEALGAG